MFSVIDLSLSKRSINSVARPSKSKDALWWGDDQHRFCGGSLPGGGIVRSHRPGVLSQSRPRLQPFFYLVQGTSAPPTGVDLQFHDDFSVDILELERRLGGLASVRS